jgi:transcriptional regulator with GAF, ATPase, and Fis domain
LAPADAAGWRFEPSKRVGSGATADVWRARDALTGRDVALKIGRIDDAAALLAAEAERLVGALSPHLPELLEVGRVPSAVREGIEAGTPYLALTWMAGHTLDASVTRSTDERRAIALAVARDVGEALAHLHAAGVAHGDVKPANILLSQEQRGTTADGPVGGRTSPADASAWRASLIDLGLATDAGIASPAGGTVRYLPPELWVGARGGDGRARDRFALGLVLAEVLAPELARSQDLAGEARRTKLAAPFDGWCGALLAPDPGARPRAAWIAEQARRLSGAARSGPEWIDQELTAIRAAYLGSRRAELASASRAAACDVRVGGAPGQWMAHAVAMSRSVRLLRGETPAGSASMGDADALTRARWLIALVGSPAARWSLAAISEASDESWWEALSTLAQDKPPASWTFADLEETLRGARGPTAGAGPAFESPIEVALAMMGDRKRAAIEAVEQGQFASPELKRATADALRRVGEAGRALAVLSSDSDPAATALRADVARRAGDRALAESEARKALQANPADERALAVLARLAIDEGKAELALSILAGTPRSSAVSEARAIALVATGDRNGARDELAYAQALASTEEARGRASGLAGYVAHQNGDIAESCAAYARAAEHAERAEALVEEATYLHGLAAVAVDLGDLGRALEAATRASLLWEHLGRPADAAYALLNRAAAFSTAGAKVETASAAREARERARWLGDPRAEAYACWSLTDVLEAEHADAVEPARFALRALEASDNQEERLRALARLLRHAPGDVSAEQIVWADDLAARESTLPAARLEWWGARAEGWLLGRGSGRAESAVLEACHLAPRTAPIGARGPAFATASALAARLGDGNAVRLLSHAQAEAARALVSMTPPDLRESVASLPWVKTAHAAEPPGVSAEQIADFETLVRALGTRDRLRPLLEQVLDSLILWTGVERGVLLLSAPDDKLVARVARNIARADLEGEQRRLSQSLARRAIELGEPVVAVDAAGEMPTLHASVHALKLRSVLAIPLIARGQTLGVVYLDDRMRRGAFGPKELAWVKLVASLAAVAIADARDQILLRRAARRAERAQQALAVELSRREAELDVIGRELLRSKDATGTRYRYDAIVGRSQPIQEMLKLVDRVTASGVPVLLIGESGSGKELVARAIHANGARGSKTFIGENCAAIPEPLLESTLFGHARGAFTGADRARPGLFEVAHQGTLFLDEVGEMSLAMQAKLLRVLEDGEVRPLGTERGRRVDVRVIAATHRNLEQLVKAGEFREDLFYRLNVISIRVPPLRQRADDIAVLVQHFIEKHGQGRRIKVSADALLRLRRYAWPGNVRQLENEVRRAIVLSDEVIEAEHLSTDVQRPPDDANAEPVGLRVRPRVDALEMELVQTALLETRGNQTKAAEMLGLSRFGLQKMIKRLGIKATS